MGLCSLVTRRNGTDHFRKRVPDDLQGILGKKTIKKSLGTANPNEAKKIKAQFEAETRELFAAKRAELNGVSYTRAVASPSLVVSTPSGITQPNATRKGLGLTLQAIADKWAENKQRATRNAGAAKVSIGRMQQKILVPEYNNIEKILKELKGIQDKLNTQETSPTELEGLSEQINLLVKDLSAIKDESTLKINTQTDKLKIDALIAEILTLKQNPFVNAKDIKPLEKIQIDLEKVQLEMKKGYVNPDKIKEYEQSIKKYEGILDFRTLEEEARKELREASQSEIVREIGPNEEIYLRRAKIRLQAFESRTKLDVSDSDYLALDKGQREALEKMKVYVNQELQNPSGKSVNELNRKLSKMFNDFPHSQASYRALYEGLNSSGAAKNITDQNTIKRDQNVYYAKNAIKEEFARFS